MALAMQAPCLTLGDPAVGGKLGAGMGAAAIAGNFAPARAHRAACRLPLFCAAHARPLQGRHHTADGLYWAPFGANGIDPARQQLVFQEVTP